MNTNRTCHVALIGQRFMGRAHSNAYAKVAHFFDLPVAPHMHTIAARDGESLRRFAQRWGWSHHTTQWREIAQCDEIDLVDVGTPNHLHAEQSIAMLEAGKHVACEKPLAGTLDDARAMRNAAAKAKGCKTFVWYNYRRCPAVALAHELVREGKLGRIYHVRAHYLQDWGGPDTPLLWRFQKKYAGSGAHGDLNAHIVDMARFITGDEITEVAGAIAETFIKHRPNRPLKNVDPPCGTGFQPVKTGVAPASSRCQHGLEARATLLQQAAKVSVGPAGAIAAGAKSAKAKGKSDVDDCVLFLARFKKGAVASFEATRLATGNQNANGIEINGEHGSIRFDFEDMNLLWYYDASDDPRTAGWRRIMCTSAGNHPYAAAWWPDAHVLGYEHGFVNMAADIMRVLGGKKPVVPLPDFADAYQTQRVLEAALIAAKNRCAVKLNEVK